MRRLNVSASFDRICRFVEFALFLTWVVTFFFLLISDKLTNSFWFHTAVVVAIMLSAIIAAIGFFLLTRHKEN